MHTQNLANIPSPPQGVVWHLGSIPIHAYALCIIAGIVAALVLGDRRWVARGGEPGVIYDIALWAVPFGLIGGRLYHVMTDWRTYFGEDGAGFVAALRIWDGGLGIWGAVALGAVGAWIACRRRGWSFASFADAVAPGVLFAQALGRLGNWFNNELYGGPTDLPWGLTIHAWNQSAGRARLDEAGDPIVLGTFHPTFLYELVWSLLVAALIVWADRRFRLGLHLAQRRQRRQLVQALARRQRRRQGVDRPPQVAQIRPAARRRLGRADGQEEMVYKGLETVRTDWTPLAQEFQQQLYQRIFKQQPYQDYVRDYVGKTLNGDFDDQLVYRKRLRRKLDDYQRNVPPHARAARIADDYNRSQGRPLQYQNGGWISYVMTVAGPEPLETRHSPIDYQHYLERQLQPVADAILPFLHDDFTTLVTGQMGLF